MYILKLNILIKRKQRIVFNNIKVGVYYGAKNNRPI